MAQASGFIVAFDGDLREEVVDELEKTLRNIRHVIGVTPVKTDACMAIATMRVTNEVRGKLMNLAKDLNKI